MLSVGLKTQTAVRRHLGFVIGTVGAPIGTQRRVRFFHGDLQDSLTLDIGQFRDWPERAHLHDGDASRICERKAVEGFRPG